MDDLQIKMLLRGLANSLRIMAATMMDRSQAECDPWHTHGVELQGAAGQIDEWIVEIDS